MKSTTISEALATVLAIAVINALVHNSEVAVQVLPQGKTFFTTRAYIWPYSVIYKHLKHEEHITMLK